MEEEDVRGDRGLSVFRLCAVSRLTLVVRCTEIGYSVSTQVFGFRFVSGWCCVVGFAWLLFVLFSLLFDSAWWNRGIAEEVTMASNGKAVTGTAVMARSANEEKKTTPLTSGPSFLMPVYCSDSSSLSFRLTLLFLLELAPPVKTLPLSDVVKAPWALLVIEVFIFIVSGLFFTSFPKHVFGNVLLFFLKTQVPCSHI